MKAMLKKERQLQEFQAAFSFLKGQSVILYGTGQYTELLLRAPLEFTVVGLMDSNRTGSTCCGLPVLSEEEVRRSGCKAMILVANLSTAPLIYRRISSFVQDCGITVYYMNGRNPAEAAMEIVPPSDWVRNKETLLAKTADYDVISFDLFDTLIARRCLLPEAVFSLVERRAREQEIPLPADFISRRREAEKALYHGGKPWYRLDDLYEWLCSTYGIPPDCAGQLRQMELDVELEMARPRDDMVSCYRNLLEQGRRVIITSDMYLTGNQMAPLLRKCGIENAELYISNERGASKHLGTLFQELRNAFPRKHILHIGDNPRCDAANARENGVDSLPVPSAAAWMETCGLGNLRAANLPMYQLFAQRCFSSVFPLDSSRKRILISRPEDVGYLFFGPLAVGYLAWLVQELPKRQIARLLFISRDGYLFYRLYRRMQKLHEGLPEADYFLTSRRCASVASIKTTEDIRFLFEEVCYSRDMPFGEMLKKVYGIAVQEDADTGRTLGELGREKAWEQLMVEYQAPILNHAAVERAGYLQYVGSLELPGGRLGMMNFVGRGVTQRCLQSVLKRELDGFYFSLEYDSARILGDAANALSWYPEPLSTHTGKRKLAEQLLLGETVFSAPHGAVLSLSKDGKPVYEETTDERAALVTACQQGVLEYLEDVLALNGGLEGFQNAVDTADQIFGLLCDGRFRLSDAIRSGFRFEDRFQ